MPWLTFNVLDEERGIGRRGDATANVVQDLSLHGSLAMLGPMRRLRILLLPHPVSALNDLRAELDEACAAHHDLHVLDPHVSLPVQMDGVDAIVDYGGNATPEFIDQAAAAGIGFMQVTTNGLDHVEVERIVGTGMTLSHCPGYLSAESLAQSATMFLLMLAGRYKECATAFAAGTMYEPMGYSVVNRVLTIVGYGASGVLLARRARALGMRIWAVDVRDVSAEEQAEIPLERVGGPDQLPEFVAGCDALSVHLHLTPETRHFIDKRLLATMKPTAWVINVARGGLIDEDALYDALLQGRIAGAGLDVFADEPPQVGHPVYAMPNVYATPHTAGGSELTFSNRARFCGVNLDRFAAGQPPLGIITGRVTRS